MALPKFNRKQITIGLAALIALVVISALVWGLGQQLAIARQMRTEEIRLEHAVATKQAHYDDLAARLEYVESDAYVEHWARVEAKMSQPGEVVVLLPTDVEEELAVVDMQPTPTSEPEEQPFWIDWWDLIFDTERP